jgi:chromosome segregation ATPase
MEKYTEKLEESLIERLRELRNKQTELIVNIGQLHLELKQMNSAMQSMESQYLTINSELNDKLKDLEAKYPNGEVDLVDGVVTFEK